MCYLHFWFPLAICIYIYDFTCLRRRRLSCFAQDLSCLILLDFARVNCGKARLISFFYVNVRVRRDLCVFEGFYYYFSPHQTNYHNANTTFRVSHLEFRRLFRGFTLLRLYTYYCYVYRYRCALTHSKLELL